MESYEAVQLMPALVLCNVLVSLGAGEASIQAPVQPVTALTDPKPLQADFDPEVSIHPLTSPGSHLFHLDLMAGNE